MCASEALCAPAIGDNNRPPILEAVCLRLGSRYRRRHSHPVTKPPLPEEPGWEPTNSSSVSMLEGSEAAEDP